MYRVTDTYLEHVNSSDTFEIQPHHIQEYICIRAKSSSKVSAVVKLVNGNYAYIKASAQYDMDPEAYVCLGPSVDSLKKWCGSLKHKL